MTVCNLITALPIFSRYVYMCLGYPYDDCVQLSVIYLEGGGTLGFPPPPMTGLFPPLKISNYYDNTCNVYPKINLLAVNVVLDATKSSLRGCKFQNFPGGACLQTTLVWVCYRTLWFPPSDKKSCIKPWLWYSQYMLVVNLLSWVIPLLCVHVCVGQRRVMQYSAIDQTLASINSTSAHSALRSMNSNLKLRFLARCKLLQYPACNFFQQLNNRIPLHQPAMG